MSDAPPTFSIVLCTRNRAATLRSALDSLRQIDYASDDFELVLVDNASSDATPDVVTEFSSTVTFEVRYVREDKVGLSAARNHGIREARGTYLLFTDDDQLVVPEVLREHRRVAEKYAARVVQGAIALSFDGPRPQWLHGRLGGMLGETADVPEGPADIELFGGNMLLRREVFTEIGGFREDLGKGRSGYSEDSELMARLISRGESIVYAPSARIYHVIGPERASAAYLRRCAFDKGRSHAQTLPKAPRLLGFAARRLGDIASFAISCARFRLTGDRNRAEIAAVDAAWQLGTLISHLDRRRDADSTRAVIDSSVVKARGDS
jgi:GT2 family glycosyltransferase